MNLFRMSDHEDLSSRRCVWVNGPVIVGAGPSGLAVGAGLKEQGVPFVVLERADCIASLWQKRTYDRLKLHLPKQFCQLPKLPFPAHFPEYPTKLQFIEYLESYAQRFDISPQFNECVQSAKYDETCGLWRVRTISSAGSVQSEVEYICRWLVVATGENAEAVVPEIDGLAGFDGKVMHACEYKSGENYRGKKVLVVGCGNSGMEVSLDLCNHKALPSMVVRSAVHILPREFLGRSIFELAMTMMAWLPLWLVDKPLLLIAWLTLGNLEKMGINRPSMGLLEMKNKAGKTPVLDIGALAKIRSGGINAVPGIKSFNRNGIELVNGEYLEPDSVVLATGYKSNVPYWLKEKGFFAENGMPNAPFPHAWKGKSGLFPRCSMLHPFLEWPLLLIIVAELLSLSRADVGTAAQYSTLYIPTECGGSSAAQFPSNNLFGAAGEGVWDHGAACGREYMVRCISAAVPGTCIQGETIKIKIVDQAATSISRPSTPGTTLVLSYTAFSTIANSTASSINVEFQQV